jgi:hypothetical protein
LWLFHQAEMEKEEGEEGEEEEDLLTGSFASCFEADDRGGGEGGGGVDDDDENDDCDVEKEESSEELFERRHGTRPANATRAERAEEALAVAAAI